MSEMKKYMKVIDKEEITKIRNQVDSFAKIRQVYDVLNTELQQCKVKEFDTKIQMIIFKAHGMIK